MDNAIAELKAKITEATARMSEARRQQRYFAELYAQAEAEHQCLVDAMKVLDGSFERSEKEGKRVQRFRPSTYLKEKYRGLQMPEVVRLFFCDREIQERFEVSQMVPEIYDFQSKEEQDAANSSLAAAMTRAVACGYVRRVERGVYAKPVQRDFSSAA